MVSASLLKDATFTHQPQHIPSSSSARAGSKQQYASQFPSPPSQQSDLPRMEDRKVEMETANLTP
jgi:hypothetical protein